MDYIDVLHRSIAKLVLRFQKNSFDFLYESDLKSLLFALALEEFGEETVPMKGGHWSTAEYGEGDTIRTIPVKSEYPTGYKTERFDIAIIDPTTVRLYDKAEWHAAGLKNDAFWSQQVLAAVELKYCQLGDRPAVRRSGCSVDIQKLRRYSKFHSTRPFLGLSMLFIQSPVLDEMFFKQGTEVGTDVKSDLGLYIVTPHRWRRFALNTPSHLTPGLVPLGRSGRRR